MRHLVIATFAFLAPLTTASAENTWSNANVLTLDLSGNNNSLAIVQTAVEAGGAENSMAVSIDGNSNGGAALIGSLVPEYLAPGRLEQSGQNNDLALSVRGDGNLFAMLQEGSGNTLDGQIEGTGNTAFVTQMGHSNNVAFSQSGNGNIVNISQTSW